MIQGTRIVDVVDEDAVRPLAVLAEALAVIGGDDDQRAIELAGGAQIRQQPADHRVGVGDLGVVRLVLRRVRLRGAVGFVRIVEMNPARTRAEDWGLRAGNRRSASPEP